MCNCPKLGSYLLWISDWIFDSMIIWKPISKALCYVSFVFAYSSRFKLQNFTTRFQIDFHKLKAFHIYVKFSLLLKNMSDLIWVITHNIYLRICVFYSMRLGSKHLKSEKNCCVFIPTQSDKKISFKSWKIANISNDFKQNLLDWSC